jgi:ATPase subunit of ABC transporter with duplicated ATPase domains
VARDAERDAIYANPDASEDDYMRAAELEHEYGEYDGYTAEARAAELLIGVGIPLVQHDGPMSAIAPGWKLRVLLAQALFGDPDILLLDEPTNHLDINSIRWLEDVLNARASTMIIISHDRHFLSSVCTHMADLDFGELRVYPGNYDDYMLASTQAREGCSRLTLKRRNASRAAGVRTALFRQRLQSPPGDFTCAVDREDQDRRHQALQPAVSLSAVHL